MIRTDRRSVLVLRGNAWHRPCPQCGAAAERSCMEGKRSVPMHEARLNAETVAQ